MQMRPFLVVLIGAAMSSSALAGVAETESPNDPGDKVVCKKFSETGSLVRQVRICKTRKQWELGRSLLRQPVGGNACAIQPCDIPGK